MPAFLLPTVAFVISLLCRCDSAGDLCDHVCISHNGQSPLQEERDMSEPGGKNCKTWRQPWATVQQPDLLTQRCEREPEGILYLGGWFDSLLTMRRWSWGGGQRQRCLVKPQCFYTTNWAWTVAQHDGKIQTEWYTHVLSLLFLLLCLYFCKDSIWMQKNKVLNLLCVNIVSKTTVNI